FEQKNTPEKSSRGSKLSKSNFSNVGSHTFKVGGYGVIAEIHNKFKVVYNRVPEVCQRGETLSNVSPGVRLP
ncbi:MAG: hypothetical protein SGJ18_15940, partial [Pseudomonadota bacterium]|nr:hypothetical protein [Pseudomonadota bacterium]